MSLFRKRSRDDTSVVDIDFFEPIHVNSFLFDASGEVEPRAVFNRDEPCTDPIPPPEKVFSSPPPRKRKRYQSAQEKKEALRIRSQENRKREKLRKQYTEQRLKYLEQENQKLKKEKNNQEVEIKLLTKLLERVGVKKPNLEIFRDSQRHVVEGFHSMQTRARNVMAQTGMKADGFFSDLSQNMVEMAESETARVANLRTISDSFFMDLSDQMKNIAESGEQKVHQMGEKVGMYFIP